MTISIQPTNEQLDEEILQTGSKFWELIQNEMPGLFNKDYWQGMLLDWVMQDPQFKVDLFHFIDVLPTLKSTSQISSHIREYILKENRKLPIAIQAAFKSASGGITAGIATHTIKSNITKLAERFIAGREPEEAIPVLRKLRKEGIGATLDLLGETTLSEKEADIYYSRYMELIDILSAEAIRWSADELLDFNHLGKIPRANISLKISAMGSFLDPSDPNGSVARVKKRVLPILLHAKEKDVFVNIDLEQWELHGITYDVFEELAMHPQLRDWPHLGIVVQAYLRDSTQDVERLFELAKRRGSPITVRLVKGAYWDYEVAHAKQYGYPCPVFTGKSTTDHQFEELSARLLDSLDYLLPAFGSHNLRSLTHAMVLAKEKHVPPSAIEFQMLYGMAEPERVVFHSQGYRVRVYSPLGELLPGMAYLVRRLLENTSNSGFLRMKYHEGTDIGKLLQRPIPAPESKIIQPKMVRGNLSTPFENCPHLDFTNKDVQSSFATKVNNLPEKFPFTIPIVINGKENFSKEIFQRMDPSDPQRKVTDISRATIEEAEKSVQSAWEGWPAWRDSPIESRARLLEKLAYLLEKDRMELAALQTYEEAKPWKEADADVAEAIDFCRYYARRAPVELAQRKMDDIPGEENWFFYQGRGPTVIIAPWNFPMAILCGMTAAALVAGNTVIMKPSELSSAIAYFLFQKMREAGFPDDVIQFLPGRGREIGNYLVEHPLIAQIGFTGSREVGLSIIEKAAKTKPGQPQVKRVVCEMGGKNAILIDEDADLDEAIMGTIRSAFGYAGQKCSACSRVIVVSSIYDSFLQRFIEVCRSIPIAPANEPSSFLGPVIDEASYRRLNSIIENPGEGAVLLYKGNIPEKGYFIPPVLFEVKDIYHRLMQEELFGPILTLFKAENFEQALEAANSTEFALTGSLYSRTPSHIDRAKEQFRVGNLYINRGSTGAFVQRQPFGGFRMSGIGTKAGGPDYLLHFADPKAITENTIRRGFAPEIDK